MAKFTIGHGLDDYIKQLGEVAENTGKWTGQAIFAGAEIVADEIRKQIQALPVQEGSAKHGTRRNPSAVEIQGMLDGLGVAKKRVTNGFSNVKIGMDGYNSHVTDKYPQGHPNAMVARSILAGTTFMNRIPFVDQAVSAVRAAAEDKMREVIEQGIEDTMR